MNVPLIMELVGLRYKLLWAKTRSRNGRIALFLAGYLLLVLFIALLTTGGFAAAIAAIRAGKGEMVAQAVLSGVFVEAVLASNILGFGLNQIFSDTELRRYPLRAADRRIARHLTGIVDPFWMLFLAMNLGLAFGLYGAGAGSFWFGLLAVLLLFVCNYILARVVGLWIEGLMRRRGGAAVLLTLVLVLALLPSMSVPLFKNHPELWPAIRGWLAYTPPFGAAAAMIHPGAAALRGLAVIALWIVVLVAALVRLENRPPARTSAETVKIEWDSRYERAGALFGPRMAPLVAHWLRFYLRNARTRAIGLLAVPLIGFLTYQVGSQMHGGFYQAALGTFPAATFLGVARITVNQFGYSGGGFRRYFLLPSDPGAALRAGSFASLLLGGSTIPVLLVAWLVLSPDRSDPARLAMLASSALTGLFLFHAAALWVSLYNPRKGNYQAALGNDLSLSGNVLLIGSMLTSLFAPRVLAKQWPAAFDPANWWMVALAAAVAAGLYLVSLRAASAALGPRRERLLAIVEGRD
jgi:hypothetical protein